MAKRKHDALEVDAIETWADAFPSNRFLQFWEKAMRKRWRRWGGLGLWARRRTKVLGSYQDLFLQW